MSVFFRRSTILKGVPHRRKSPALCRAGPFNMVPKRGLEPPPGFPDMDLNHARLPIPPLRQRWKSPGLKGFRGEGAQCTDSPLKCQRPTVCGGVCNRVACLAPPVGGNAHHFSCRPPVSRFAWRMARCELSRLWAKTGAITVRLSGEFTVAESVRLHEDSWAGRSSIGS